MTQLDRIEQMLKQLQEELQHMKLNKAYPPNRYFDPMKGLDAGHQGQSLQRTCWSCKKPKYNPVAWPNQNECCLCVT